MAGGSIVTLLLSDSDVRAICDVGALAAYIEEDALRLMEAKGSGAQLPERMNLGHGSVFLRVMPSGHAAGVGADGPEVLPRLDEGQGSGTSSRCARWRRGRSSG